LRNDAEAEDAVQQVFLDVFRSIQQFDPRKESSRPGFSCSPTSGF
jgi:DNA-directed RNA polymerase specialized sigma24 family protein